MPRPSGPPLLVACYDNKIADVRALLASGADPRAAPSHDEQKFGSSLERTSPSLSSCIFSCIHFGYFEVLEVLLATGQYDLVHEVQNTMTSSHSSSRGRVAARCRPRRHACFLSTRSPTKRSRRCLTVTTPSTRRSSSIGEPMRSGRNVWRWRRGCSPGTDWDPSQKGSFSSFASAAATRRRLRRDFVPGRSARHNREVRPPRHRLVSFTQFPLTPRSARRGPCPGA